MDDSGDFDGVVRIYCWSSLRAVADDKAISFFRITYQPSLRDFARKRKVVAIHLSNSSFVCHLSSALLIATPRFAWRGNDEKPPSLRGASGASNEAISFLESSNDREIASSCYRRTRNDGVDSEIASPFASQKTRNDGVGRIPNREITSSHCGLAMTACGDG